MKAYTLDEIKQLYVDYYNIVDINETKGFTSKLNKNGFAKNANPRYEYPEGAGEIQIKIMKAMNFLNRPKNKEIKTKFVSWLRKYERKLKSKTTN